MILVEATDTFQIQPYIYMEKYDILMLKKVYQKLIGKTAIRTYLYLNTLRKFESYGAIAIDLEITLPILVDCFKQLERVNLIRTFKTNHHITHLIIKPESFKQIKLHPMFQENYELKSMTPSHDLLATNEITEHFNQIEKSKVNQEFEIIIDYLKTNKIKQKRNIIREIEEVLKLYPIEELLIIECLEKARYFDFIDLELFKKEVRKEYSKIELFNSSLTQTKIHTIKQLETENSESKNDPVIKQLASNFEKNSFDQQIQNLLNETPKNNSSNEEIKKSTLNIKSTAKTTKDLDEIKHELLVKEYTSVPIHKYLELRLGYSPTALELKKLEQLSNSYLIPTSMINVLIDYAVFHKIGLNFKYYEAVLRDWKNNNIFTVEAAIFYLRSLDVLKIEQKQKTNSTNKQNQIDWQEWYENIKVSPNNMRYTNEEGWE